MYSKNNTKCLGQLVKCLVWKIKEVGEEEAHLGDGVRQVRRWDEITVTTEDVLMRPSLVPKIRKRLKQVARSGKHFLMRDPPHAHVRTGKK